MAAIGRPAATEEGILCTGALEFPITAADTAPTRVATMSSHRSIVGMGAIIMVDTTADTTVDTMAAITVMAALASSSDFSAGPYPSPAIGAHGDISCGLIDLGFSMCSLGLV